MFGGRNINNGYIGLTIDAYNPDDNIDFYNIIKNDNPKKITLYGMKTKIKLDDVSILEYIENKSNFIVKQFRRGNIFIGSSYINFKNELNSIKKLYKFLKDKIETNTTIKPLFKYNNIDIYALSYNYNFFIFQEKCYNTIDNIKFTQKEFNKMIDDIYETIEILQNNKFLHNDLKPDNIIYCNNKYKIIDWDKAHHTKDLFKSLIVRGNFIFNHPYKFYNKGIPLFIYNFLIFIFKKIDNKNQSWIFKLKSFKLLEDKIHLSINEFIEKKPNNLNKYYDNYSFALIIIYLAEKNKLTYPKEIVNKLLNPFNIKL